MASGSSSSSKSPALPTSLAPAQHNPNASRVVAPSPRALLNENRYVCEVCLKGFLRKQNLSLHRRAHNLPFCLKSRAPKDPVGRKVYLCPEPTCQHHNRSRALGDFGGLKKHYLRKHCTQKNHKCDTCSKSYAAETDLKAHSKVCGKRKQICHCGARFTRGYNIVSHQDCCTIQEHKAAVGHSPKLQMGDKSGKNKFPIGSSSSYAPTYNLEGSSMKSTSDDNHSNLKGLYTSHSDPNISAVQNLSKSYASGALYQSQLYPSEKSNGSLMTDTSIGLNLGQIFPDFFSPSSSQQNQHKLQADSDMRFYADLLTDKIPLDNVNHMGDGRNIYGNGDGSNSKSSGGVYNTNSLNGMPNFVCGEGSSSFNQEFDGSYDQGSYYSYGECSGQSDYGYGMEVSNFETSAATGGIAPYGQILNQFRGFWF
uniref:protein indeterminate-domain 11-like n=1 Tax=Erigeron canadensis TaxID=72917 RepID=UPI001CB9BA42|nr:protein indeterminate-domain 11-like [Erigeron canadensis]